jgi:hypothetical protein
VSGRKNLAKLSFACQVAGTARLAVRAGHLKWTSPAKHYACRQARGQVTIRLPKSVARRLRHPGGKVVASLTINDGSTPRTLAVNLGRTASHEPAHAASRSTNGFWDNTVTACDRRDNGYGPIGSVFSGAPPLDYYPPPGGWMWLQWRSWLVVWDGNNNTWSVVAGAQDGSDGSNPWSHPSIGWLDETRALLLTDEGTQSYTVQPGHNLYTIVAVQSWYADTLLRWYGGETHWTHSVTGGPGGATSGEFCYFP